MNRLTPLILFGLAAGCASQEGGQPIINEPLPTHLFGGSGESPHWIVTVDEREITLVIDAGGRRRDADYRTHRYPGVRASSVNGVRRWTAGRGTAVIGVEAWDEACVLRGYDYQERARVRLSGRELNGCGGPPPIVAVP